MQHIPVLLKETVEALNLKEGKCVVDGTMNGGGHAREIISRIMPKGTFIGIELDPVIIKSTEEEIRNEFVDYNDRIFFENDNYKNLAEILKNGNYPRPDALILDLGFSSIHIDESRRGFSFQKDEILDMRYNSSSGKSAYEIVNGMDEKSLADIIWKFGEERFSRHIAKAIVEARRKEKISTTKQLSTIISGAVPGFYRRGKINPATKTFQALRICVNDELGNLDKILRDIPKIMAPNGRVAIISFHSLEDRMVKTFFNQYKKDKTAIVLTKKPIIASDEESASNPKSRSAKMRVIEFF
jgi:16S rRNA (cytosine1402-N4)-methyltransferase